MKLKDYIKYQINELQKKNKGYDIFCSDLSLHEIQIDVLTEKYWVRLLVRLNIMENKKNEITEAIKIIFKEIEKGNYDCIKIELEDGSSEINMFNTDNIRILFVKLDEKMMYKYEEGIKDIRKFMLASEAVKKYNLSDSTIRRAIHDGRIINGIDCFKEGRDWYVSIKTLDEMYGKNKEDK